MIKKFLVVEIQGCNWLRTQVTWLAPDKEEKNSLPLPQR